LGWEEGFLKSEKDAKEENKSLFQRQKTPTPQTSRGVDFAYRQSFHTP
jgi:hypothetical protein